MRKHNKFITILILLPMVFFLANCLEGYEPADGTSGSPSTGGGGGGSGGGNDANTIESLSIGGSPATLTTTRFESVQSIYSSDSFFSGLQFLSMIGSSNSIDIPLNQSDLDCTPPDTGGETPPCVSELNVVSMSLSFNCGSTEGACGTLTKGDIIDLAVDKGNAPDSIVSSISVSVIGDTCDAANTTKNGFMPFNAADVAGTLEILEYADLATNSTFKVGLTNVKLQVLASDFVTVEEEILFTGTMNSRIIPKCP